MTKKEVVEPSSSRLSKRGVIDIKHEYILSKGISIEDSKILQKPELYKYKQHLIIHKS